MTYKGVGGEPPAVTAPLEQVQIDHTVIDLIVVDDRDTLLSLLAAVPDPRHRRVHPLRARRVVTLEAPSAVSVGCASCMSPATSALGWKDCGVNVEMDWQMSGKPFAALPRQRSRVQERALRRGCEQHGIRLDYRPLGQPHYGGIVERIIGTAMRMIREHREHYSPT